jgi:hypothetical protein
MPRGPKGEKRPADVIGAAIMVAKIATGEIDDDLGKAPKRAKGGRKGGQNSGGKSYAATTVRDRPCSRSGAMEERLSCMFVIVFIPI